MSWTPANRAALAALAASALLCLVAAEGARRLDPPPAAGRGAPLPELPEAAAERGAGSDSLILAAVARDPFRADRRRPPGRYRMPGSAPEPAPYTFAYTPPAAPPPLALLGTVVLPDGRGLAAVGARGGESRVLRTGESLAGFRLVRVGSGTATLTDGDTTLMLKTEGGTP